MSELLKMANNNPDATVIGHAPDGTTYCSGDPSLAKAVLDVMTGQAVIIKKDCVVYRSDCADITQTAKPDAADGQSQK
jgi:hypothetical protein